MAGEQVYLDGGSRLGLQVGDGVQMLLANGVRRNARLVAVATETSRAQLVAGAESDAVVIPPGTIGTIWIPASRLAAPSSEAASPPGKAGAGKVPDHPPWERPVEPAKAGEPLLAPAFGRPIVTRCL